jgi:hypothetical protein
MLSLDKLEFRRHTCFPVDTIFGILPDENYFDTRAFADIVSVCLHMSTGTITVRRVSMSKTKERAN